MSKVYSALISRLLYKLAFTFYWFRALLLPCQNRSKTVLLGGALFLGDLCMALPSIMLIRKMFPQHYLVLIARQDMGYIASKLKIFDEVVTYRKTTGFIGKLASFRASKGICIFQNRFVPLFRSLGITEVSYLDQDYCIRHGAYEPLPDFLYKYVASSLCSTKRSERLVADSRVCWKKFDQHHFTLPPIFAVIHCDGRGSFKTLPDWVIILITSYLVKTKMSIVLTGQFAGDSIEGLESAIDLRGTTSLIQVLAICQNARAVFGPDTGVTHFSSSNKVPTWVALGPSSPVQYGDSSLVPYRVSWGIKDLVCRSPMNIHGLSTLIQVNCKGEACHNLHQGYCLSVRHRNSAKISLEAFFGKFLRSLNE